MRFGTFSLFAVTFVLATSFVASAEILGGPGYARARLNVPISDDFSGGTLETRYYLGGAGVAPYGSAFESNGLLYLVAGPSMSEEKVELALQRYFFPNESFHLQVDAGISSESKVLGSVSLVTVDMADPANSLTMVGLVHEIASAIQITLGYIPMFQETRAQKHNLFPLSLTHSSVFV